MQKLVKMFRFAALFSAIHHAAAVGTYLHGNRIGVMVELDVDNKELARDIAMHIAASKPIVISPEDVPQDLLRKKKKFIWRKLQPAASHKKSLKKWSLVV